MNFLRRLVFTPRNFLTLFTPYYDKISNYLKFELQKILEFKKKMFYSKLLSSRLLRSINILQTSSLSDLKDINYVTNIIRKVGLSDIYGGNDQTKYLYGKDIKYLIPKIKLRTWVGYGGLLQIPQQLSECLIYLSNFKIKNFIEIGTWKGWTSSIVLAYLQRFNKSIKGLTIDIEKFFEAYNFVKKKIPLKYKLKTSDKFKTQIFNLCFIDGNHEYTYVKRDFENLGKNANICMFHDINDQPNPLHPGCVPGVAKFWNELKDKGKNEYIFKEYLYHSEGRNIMGIGLALKKSFLKEHKGFQLK